MNNNLRRLVSTTLSLLVAAGPSWAATGRTLPTGLPVVAPTAVVPALPSALPALPAVSAGLDLPATKLDAAAAPLAVLSQAPELAGRAELVKPSKAAVKAARPDAAPLAPSQAPNGLLGRLSNAVVRSLSWTGLFDAARPAPALVGAVGLRPLPQPVLPQGADLELGNAPTNPTPQQAAQVNIHSVDIPGTRNAGGVFDAGPRVLNADPTSEADVERALREMVDLDAARYGVTSAELGTIHVRHVAGDGNQADSFFAYFRQQKKSSNPDGTSQIVAVNGSYLSFTVKVVAGKPTVFAAMARLYPTISVNTSSAFTDAQLKDRAEQQLPQNMGITLELSERKVLYHDGRWKTVNLYSIEGLPIPLGVLVAVDVNSGEVFAWDARMGAGPVGGAVVGRAEKDDHRPNGKMQLEELALPHLNVSIGGKAGVTDAEGRFAGAAEGETAEFSAVLSGRWAQINDRARKPIKISAVLTAGQGDAMVVANPALSDELTVDQVNTYRAVTIIHDWWSSRLKGEKRIDKAIPANVNIDDECNAFYTPGRPSLNFFKSSRRCSDTGRPGVVAHEYGHFVDDMVGGIVNGGLSEGWGDIGSMFLLGTPIIGEGFLKNANPSWIRHGENTYQYSDGDEVHDQGQAWMGFGWKLRKALIASLDEAKGAAMAETLIIPTLFAKAADIPSQMAQVLLNAMDKDGRIAYEKEIRGAAKAHGIELPKNPGLIMSLWNWLTTPWRTVSVTGTTIDRGEGGVVPPVISSEALPEAAFLPQGATSAPLARARVTFKAGAFIRGQLRADIARYLESHKSEGLRGRLTERKGGVSPEYLLELEGPEAMITHLVDRLQDLRAR